MAVSDFMPGPHKRVAVGAVLGAMALGGVTWALLLAVML